MPEYAYISRILSRILDLPKFWVSQNSLYRRVLNLQALHSVLNMPEYVLTEF